MQTGDNPNFISIKSNVMTLEKINHQNILEIAAMRFKTVVAEASQEVTLTLAPEAGIQGFIVLLQSPLPSIH